MLFDDGIVSTPVALLYGTLCTVSITPTFLLYIVNSLAGRRIEMYD